MEETKNLFEKQNVVCHEMLPFSKVLDKAIELGQITEEDRARLDDWLANPWTWAARHGLVPQTNEN